MKTETTALKQTIVVPASPEEVYEAFVDPKKHCAFTGSKATGRPKTGGKFTAWDGYIFGKFLELEPGKRLVQEWQTTDWPPGYPPSRFELTFKQVPEGTEVTMVHSNIPKEQEEELAEGWEEFYWKPLREYFEKPKK
ncbi:MAG: SRPBCC domain-containing protein [Candidatus Bathyarchaeia archaeon]